MCGPLHRAMTPSASFLKKRSKKLLLNAGTGTGVATSTRKQKFFASFFSKKKRLPVFMIQPDLIPLDVAGGLISMAQSRARLMLSWFMRSAPD
jgi:hypothetical protein